MSGDPKTPETLGAQRWLEHLARHLPIARGGEDAEGVHQLRVAAARLEVHLRLAGRRALLDDLRWLRERAATVRDLDVLLACELPSPFAQWLAGERLVARAGLLEALESVRLKDLLEGWRWVPGLELAPAEARRRGLARRAARRARRALDPRAPLDAFHAVRRALRRLRYANEWLGRSADKLKELQTTLGELNDRAVARRLLESCPCAAECEDYRAGLERELARCVARARLALARCYPREEG